ncbi:MAG: putative aminohydrolase SsnA [Eubacteriales bacterium]|nr:putative aminohydrolase SsnA [Eubacteriales bacterium]
MLLYNANIFTNDERQPFIEDGAIVVNGNEITAVGKRQDLETAYPQEEKIDLGGKLVLPGLINCHTHIYSAYARGMAVSKPTRNFIEVLENLWWALDKKLTVEDAKLCAYQTMIESIRNGVTCLFDHHAAPNGVEGSLDAIAEVALELGMRADLCYELTDRDGERVRDLGLAENRHFIERCKRENNDYLRAHFGLHASFTLSDESMAKAADIVHELDAAVHCHCAEGLDDQLFCVRQHDCRVIERLERFGLMSDHALVVHLCHCAARELDIIKKHDSIALHNPGSNMNNAVGRTPLEGLLEREILTGLGTDAYTHDMYESMKTGKVLYAHDRCQTGEGFGQMLKLQFENNPKIAARFWDKPMGRIQAGAYADLCAYEYLPFTPLNANSIGGHILFGLSGKLCTDNMINGKFVMRNREILGCDEARVAARSRERAAEIWPLM